MKRAFTLGDVIGDERKEVNIKTIYIYCKSSWLIVFKPTTIVHSWCCRDLSIGTRCLLCGLSFHFQFLKESGWTAGQFSINIQTAGRIQTAGQFHRFAKSPMNMDYWQLKINHFHVLLLDCFSSGWIYMKVFAFSHICLLFMNCNSKTWIRFHLQHSPLMPNI